MSVKITIEYYKKIWNKIFENFL